MKKLMITLACAAFCFAQQSFAGKTYYWNWAGTVANTATNQYNWTDAANWTDANGAAVETCPGAGDIANFGKGYTATARWVRIPAEGITVTRINVPDRSQAYTLNFTGGPITFDTTKDDYSYYYPHVGGTTHVWFYNDLKFKNQRVKFYGSAVVAGRMDIPAICYLQNTTWQRLDFQATSTETDIVNPWPTNITFAASGAQGGGISTIAPYYMTADSTKTGCILKKDSPFVTGSKLAARSGDLAQLPVGTLVTCSDPEALQPGTFLKAIYTANIIELSQPPLKDLEDTSLTFAAFKPSLKYEVCYGGDPRTGCSQNRYSASQDYRQLILDGLMSVGLLGQSPATNAKIIVWPRKSGDCGDFYMAGNGVRYFEFPTNKFGVAGFSTNNVPQLSFKYDQYASCGLHLTVPEEVETQPMRIADFNWSTGTDVTKVGPGTVYLRVDKKNNPTCTVNNPVKVNEGGLRLGTTAAVNNALEKGATISKLTVAKGTSFIADDNAKLSITVASFSEAKRLEVGTNAWVKMVYSKDYTATNFTMGAGSTLTLAAAATGTAVKKVTAVKDFTIGGSSEANAVSTLDAGLTVSEGMSLALSAVRPIPGSVAVTGTVTLPKQGVLKVSGVTSATPPGTYEILTPGTLTLTGDGDFNWTCESDSPRRIFKLRLVGDKLLLDVFAQGLILMVK